jgi:GGDEF domain-containing protein/predicted transcriptional regulator
VPLDACCCLDTRGGLRHALIKPANLLNVDLTTAALQPTCNNALTQLKQLAIILHHLPTHRIFTMKTIAKQPYGNNHNIKVEAVLRYVEQVQPETELEKIFACFSENTSLRAIPVVKDGRPVGLISRYKFEDNLAQPCRRELLGKKPCTDMMNAEPLLVEKSTPIHELSGFLSESEIRHFTDGFIITEQGRYIGIGTCQDLLRVITNAQIEATRYANPLTLLPGYVPINEHIECLLQSGKSFAVCYADLDNLKPFNDVCGHRKGDELIQFTAGLLANVCDPVYDFIGHIGGDDFILVLQSKDWEQRCHRALSAFAHTSSTHFDKDHRSIGGYLSGDRQGRIVHHPLPTLSIGAVWVNLKLFNSHHKVDEAATSAKKIAQGKPGNSLFIEKRRLQPHEVTEIQHDDTSAYYG